jgi:hypothetical protein
MCLLTFLPAGVQPDLDALSNGTLINNDGHGFAIVADHQVLVHHGIGAEQVIDAFADARRRHPDGPALFHSRFATHGATLLDNCHPFPVGGDPRTVIAHNGVLPANAQPAKHDPRSDTRIAADTFIPALGSLRIRRIRKQVERWMGPHNKIVVLTVDRSFTQQAYILNESSGTWDGGVWYSNDGYLPPRSFGRGRLWSYLGWDDQDDRGLDLPDRCPNCWPAIAESGFCTECGCCLDCGQFLEYCQCYQSAHLSPQGPNLGQLHHT